MTQKYFCSVKPGKQIGDGTVGDLVDWLEIYVNLLFPENGIEYFSDNRHGGPNALKRFQPVPVSGSKPEDVHHVVCYVRPGSCEGRIIEIALYLRDDTFKSVVWMKTFGSSEESWEIAHAIDAALNQILFWYETPEIVEMGLKLPKEQKWRRETSLAEEVIMSVTADAIKVATASGTVFDDRSWRNEDRNAKFYVEPRLRDWEKVLTNMKARYRVVKETRLVIPDCPGYVISDRGVEGCNGYYLLPPGGNPNDDRDYVGYFFMEANAIKAAQLHRDGKTGELASLIGSLETSKGQPKAVAVA
jgi:hypothetical protein